MNEKEKKAKYFNKLKAHLPIAKDPTAVIVRGHLLVEELLEEFISIHLREPTAIKDARLTFHQKFRLVQGLIGSKSDNPMWKSVEQLNKLRNQISHNLPNKEQISKINNALKVFFKDEFDEIPDDIYSKSKALRIWINCLCAELHGYINGVKMCYEMKEKHSLK